jgi:hypothetical protein
MELLALAKTAIDLLPRGWKLLKQWNDPVRAQAARVLEAFEAHGVKSQQIARLLPASIEVKTTAWTSPETLKDATTPALLKWTAGTLALNPAWLDSERVCRHVAFTAHYKHPAQLFNWLRERYQRSDKTQWEAGASLCVLCACDAPMTNTANGPLVLMLRETFAEVNGSERYRYTLLSEGWRLDHTPCTASLAAACAIAQHMHLPIHALTATARQLPALEEGKCFAGGVWTKAKARWHPDDFVKAPPGKGTEWMQAVRKEARRMLADDKLGHLMPD